MLFVIDGSARDRLQDADDLLTSLLMEKELHGIPMVFLANKKDIEGTHFLFNIILAANKNFQLFLL